MDHEKETVSEEETNPEIMVEIEQSKIDAILEEVSDYKNKYLHLLADAENARKRLHKERAEISQHAFSSLLLDFIDPIDHMKNALKFTQNASEEVRNWALGFDMIFKQLSDVLTQNGVMEIEAIGKEFDPHLHDAVEMVETDEKPSGTIVAESLKGYTLRGKTLRPSKVKVAQEIQKDNLSKGDNN
jgi:molecular chaperone GrpE